MSDTRGPRCCYTDCDSHPTMLHFFTGVVSGFVREEAEYTGGSFCSWQHLRYWLADHASYDEMGVPFYPPLRQVRSQTARVGEDS